ASDAARAGDHAAAAIAAEALANERTKCRRPVFIEVLRRDRAAKRRDGNDAARSAGSDGMPVSIASHKTDYPTKSDIGLSKRD
ncbi:hypothetical protein, partial [Burkholderia oklahomensis]|uniref:hypothetical protein n=1 Tax=Burkholderia oklahomensis TaxID=342113 RepID=UPI00016A2ACD